MKLTTIEEFERNKKGYLALFIRDTNIREIRIIEGFKFYFYKPSKDGIYESIDKEKVKKLEFDSYNEVPEARKLYDKTFEADVHATTRYLVDAVPKIEKCNLRIQYCDIETDPPSNRITCIAAVDNFLNKCVAFAWREDLTPSQIDKQFSFPSGYTFKTTIHLYNSRKNMLSDYIRFVKKTDPDILTGHFFVKYDAKKIMQEIKSVGLNPSDLSPIHRAYLIGEVVGKYEQNIKILGRILFDMMKAYSVLEPQRLPDHSLEFLAQRELGEGKVKRTMNFHDMWLKDIEHLIEYCCKDAVLVRRIDEKKKLIEYFDTLRRFVGCDWSSLFSETLLLDTYILRKVHNKIVLPTKKKIDIGAFEGAKVFKPTAKGIHKNIILIDLKSLYPSIILTWNMSPETLVKKETYIANSAPLYTLENGVSFKKEPLGLLPEILLELMQLRAGFKEKMKNYPFGTSEYETLDHQQTATKVLMNALYGAMSFHNFRLATPEIASSVTFLGRTILEFLHKLIKEKGYEIIAGDTDSLFIKSLSTDSQAIYKEMVDLVASINIKLKEFIKSLGSENNYIQIEPKKIYSSFMISEKKMKGAGTAKKRYAGTLYWADGEFLDSNSDKTLDIVGFESKRSDTSALSRQLQKDVIRMLLTGKSKDEVHDHIHSYIEKLSNNEFELEYIGISKGLSKSIDSYKIDNPHRRGAIYSNIHLGTSFGIGDKPKIIYVTSTNKYPKTDVVAFNSNEDVPKDFVVDVKTMIDKTIIKKLEHILDASGISIESLIYNLTSLTDFM